MTTLVNAAKYVWISGIFGTLILPQVIIGGIGFYAVLILAPLYIILLLAMSLDRLHLGVESILLTFLSFTIIFLSLISWSRNLTPYHWGDIRESIKYLQFIPYTITPFISHDRNRFITDIKNAFKWSSVVYVIVGVCQASDLPVLSELIINLYLTPESNHLEGLSDRIIATGSDPNVGAVIGFFLSSYFLSSYVLNKNTRHLIFFGIILIVALFTQGRTATLAFAFSFTVFMIFYSGISTTRRITIVLSLFFLSFLIFKYIDFSYITIGLLMALDGSNNSLNVRYENISNAWDLFYISPVFGWGPAKAIHSTVIDSEIALIVQRYGIIGVLVFSCAYLISLKNTINFWESNRNRELSNTFLVFLVAAPILMLTNNVFNGYQLFSVIFLILSTTYRLKKNLK